MNGIAFLFDKSSFALKFAQIWTSYQTKIGTYNFSHFSQFLARNRSIFLASREKSKPREMCRSNVQCKNVLNLIHKVT